MQKLIKIYLLIIISSPLFGQSLKIAWLSDMHIGAPGADEDLAAVVEHINSRNDINLVVADGDITEKGRNSELAEAKLILDKLDIQYLIIPGNHDTKWSESGLTKFRELFGDDKFLEVRDDLLLCGINSGIPWRGGGGHITPEDLEWLETSLDQFPDKEIILFVHHPLNDAIDNWFKVTNILSGRKITAVLTGHTHRNIVYDYNGIPGAGTKATLDKGGGRCYTVIEDHPDSLALYEVCNGGADSLWHSIAKVFPRQIEKIDSLQLQSYNADIKAEITLDETMSASLLTYDSKIYAATLDGNIYCFNSDGEGLWSYSEESPVFSKPAAAEGMLTYGTIGGVITKLDTETGRLLGSVKIDEPVTSQTIIYPLEYMNEDNYAAVFGTASGRMLCYDLYYFNPVWENASAEAMIETKPLHFKDRLFYGAWDHYFYCIDAKTGLLNWKWTENKNFYYSTAAHFPVTDSADYVFVSSPDKHISKIDIYAGTTEWRRNDYRAWESIGIDNSGGHLFIKSVSDTIYIANALDGSPVKEIPLDYGIDTMPIEINEYDGNVFIGLKNGNVYMLNQDYEPVHLLFTGTARVHTVRKVSENRYAASNMDGTIVIFEINKK